MEAPARLPAEPPTSPHPSVSRGPGARVRGLRGTCLQTQLSGVCRTEHHGIVLMGCGGVRVGSTSIQHASKQPHYIHVRTATHMHTHTHEGRDGLGLGGQALPFAPDSGWIPGSLSPESVLAHPAHLKNGGTDSRAPSTKKSPSLAWLSTNLMGSCSPETSEGWLPPCSKVEDPGFLPGPGFSPQMRQAGPGSGFKPCLTSLSLLFMEAQGPMSAQSPHFLSDLL